jgi:HAD superfamily hydrolase (TIGR01490 family)
MKKRLAIFDVDGTIYRWGLVFELYEQFVKRGLFPQKVYQETINAYLGWLDRKNDFNDYEMRATKIFEEHARGILEKDALKITDEIIAEKKNHVYRYPTYLAKKLKKQGYYLVFISGSPGFIVKRLAKEFDCDRAYGKLYEVVDGRFTGKIKFGEEESYIGMNIDKTVLIKRVIDVVPFEVDLSNSVAMGDTVTDIKLLESVGKPIAFNPSQGLLVEAQKRGWRIVIERKDVVYDVEKFKTLKI